MSDAGSETASNHPEVEAQEVEVAAQSGPMSVEDALEQVIKTALVHDGLARGLRECAKALDKKEAHLCVLVETVTEAEYLKLIEALCTEHGIQLIKVSDAKVLGQSLAALALSSPTTVRTLPLSRSSLSTSRPARCLAPLLLDNIRFCPW
ncbi:40S ribosomal protein S12-A [Cryptococcus bacillisporus CA1280]|uniref:40S ribosomal protein eS12 n=1 Tax=Cryptococcus bacillisporus CA1280 TaxID=1296109 RepID=UPI0033691A67